MSLTTLLASAACTAGGVVLVQRAVQAEREQHRLAEFPVDATPGIRFVSRQLTIASALGVVALRLAVGPAARWFVLLGAFFLLRVCLGLLVSSLGRRG